MTKNILIAGKELPSMAEFADAFALSGSNVVVADESGEAKGLSSKDIKVLSWNKCSAVAARALILQAESLVGLPDRFIFYFDAEYFSRKFAVFSLDMCSRANDSMILGFQYLSMEIFNRIQQHGSKATVVFILKPVATLREATFNPVLKSSGADIANPVVAAAEAAFANFAENIAAMNFSNENVQVILVSGDEHNEVLKKDSLLSQWLDSYIDASVSAKHKPNAKNALSWVKAGSKSPSSFSLFK